MKISWIDIVILVIVAIAAFGGLKEGAVRMLFGLVGLLLGVFIAGRFGTELGGLILTSAPPWGTIIAYVIIFVGIALAVGIIGMIVSRVLHAAMLGWVDHLVGAIAGILSGLLSVAAILAVLSVFMPDALPAVKESQLGTMLIAWSPFLLALLPRM